MNPITLKKQHETVKSTLFKKTIGIDKNMRNEEMGRETWTDIKCQMKGLIFTSVAKIQGLT